MRSQAEIETEREKLDKIWNNLQSNQSTEALFFAMGALHALEWVLSHETNALSNLSMLKASLQKT